MRGKRYVRARHFPSSNEYVTKQPRLARSPLCGTWFYCRVELVPNSGPSSGTIPGFDSQGQPCSDVAGAEAPTGHHLEGSRPRSAQARPATKANLGI